MALFCASQITTTSEIKSVALSLDLCKLLKRCLDTLSIDLVVFAESFLKITFLQSCPVLKIECILLIPMKIKTKYILSIIKGFTL